MKASASTTSDRIQKPKEARIDRYGKEQRRHHDDRSSHVGPSNTVCRHSSRVVGLGLAGGYRSGKTLLERTLEARAIHPRMVEQECDTASRSDWLRWLLRQGDAPHQGHHPPRRRRHTPRSSTSTTDAPTTPLDDRRNHDDHRPRRTDPGHLRGPRAATTHRDPRSR